MNKWKFGVDNDKLVSLVLNGKKTATTSIYNGTVEEIGTKSVLIFDDGKDACIIQNVDNVIIEFKNVKWDIAKLEGENNSLEEWRENHYKFFSKINNKFNENTLVLIELFEVVEKFR